VIEIELKGIKSNDLSGIYKDIAENFGVEIAFMIFNHYKGLQVTFPTRFLAKEYVKERIRIESDGKNIKTLARKYGYSERWIRELNGK
jgi:Mor family transcriptional regulator